MCSRALFFMEIHLSTKNNRTKYIKKRHKWKFPIVFSLDFLKKMSFFAAFAQNDFSKKSATKKTHFFPGGRNFWDWKSKKRPQITDRRLSDPKIILEEISVKKDGIARNFGRGPPPHNFRPFFQKIVLCKSSKNEIFLKSLGKTLKEIFHLWRFVMHFAVLFFVERCISTNKRALEPIFCQWYYT